MMHLMNNLLPDILDFVTASFCLSPALSIDLLPMTQKLLPGHNLLQCQE